jgi:hypothetical protein
MMDAREIRRLNLRYLADKYGRDKLAQKLGYNDVNYLNQVLGKHVNIGPRAPRNWETALDLEQGWFDIQHLELWDNTASREIAEPSKTYLSRAVSELSTDELMEMLSEEQKRELERRMALEATQARK